jgi:hypothetical protein
VFIPLFSPVFFARFMTALGERFELGRLDAIDPCIVSRSVWIWATDAHDFPPIPLGLVGSLRIACTESPDEGVYENVKVVYSAFGQIGFAWGITR